MKPKNYHPIFSEAPTHMGGLYLLQSLKQQVTRNASLKKILREDFSKEKIMHKVESTSNLRLQGESSKLPKLSIHKGGKTKTLLNHHKEGGQKQKSYKEEGIHGLIDIGKERGSFRDNSQPKKSTFGGDTKQVTLKKKKTLDNVLNCSSLDNERDNEGIDNEHNTELLDKKDYIKNAKSYKIEELGETNDSFMESTVPVQKIKHCLNLLGGNFTQQNLIEYSIESNIIIDQPFYYVKKTRALREVSLLIMALIKFNLISEEVKFINAVSILLQSFPKVTEQEDTSAKFMNKFFDSLDSLVDLSMTPLTQIFYMIVDFLNNMAEKIPGLEITSKKLYLCRSFDLMAQMYLRLLQVADEEADLGINQFLKVSEKNPWVLIERLTEETDTRNILLQEEEVFNTFARLIQDFINVVISLQETDFTGIKKAVVYSDMFGVALSAVRHQDIRKKLFEKLPSDQIDLSKMIEYLMSTIIQISFSGQLTETVQDKMERNLQLAQKAVSSQGINRSLEVEDIVQLIFKLLCDKTAEMSSPRRIEFATEVALLLREIAFAKKDLFVRAFKHNRKNLDSIVFMFNTASGGSNKKEFARQKETFLKPVIEVVGLLK